MTFGFHVGVYGFDGGSTSQFAFDGAEAVLLSRDEDAAWILRMPFSTSRTFTDRLRPHFALAGS